MKKIYFLLPALLSVCLSAVSQISFTGGTYTQDFNTLANTGSSSILPSGWLITESGTNANGTYTAGTGSSNAGDTYSFGSSGSSERALGGLLSGSLVPTIGAQFVNNTGSTLSKLEIAYTGEQWRLGTAGREDRLDFQISTNATSLITGTWTDINDLDFIAPSTGPTVGLKDGNADANKTSISYTITGLSIPNGATFYIRWIDFNASGADDGLAIDDFSLGLGTADVTAPVILSLSPSDDASNVAPALKPTIQFDENIEAGTGSFIVHNVTKGTQQNIAVNASQVSGNSVVIPVTLQPETNYYIEVPAGIVHDAAGIPFAGLTGGTAWNFTTGEQQLVFDFNDCAGAALSGGFTQYSVSGPIVWACTTFGQTGNALQINGFAGGAQLNEDWLISPAFNFTSFNYPLLTFASRSAFSGPSLTLKVSTDYDGISNPADFTWTEVRGRFPEVASDYWKTSADIDLSAFKAENVYIAFVYNSSPASGASRWTIDDFKIVKSATAPAPGFTYSPEQADFDYAASGSQSAAIGAKISAYNLSGDLTITAPAGFEVSADNNVFKSSISISQNLANTTDQEIYIRFAPTTPNTEYSGLLNISSAGLNGTATALTGSSLRALKVVNWNLEWFGSPAQNPANDNLQQQNVQTILKNLNADIYAVEEVVDTLRLKQVVDNMPGYAYTISDFGSYTDNVNDPDYPLAQKIGFIYRTSVVKNLGTYGVLRSGGSPDAFNAWASGRYPYMMKATVTLEGVTANIDFVVIHAKANTGTTAEKIQAWQRRKLGADELKDSLDVHYPYSNVLVLGDFNDDLDVTIAPASPLIPHNETSYIRFMQDPQHYKPVTYPLSLAGLRSTVSNDNVIDHQMASNEMGIAYVPNSAKILTYVSSLVGSYASTTTDHYPVIARYDISYFKRPIDLSSFTGTSNQSKVVFDWATLHEINSNWFVIERSRNGIDFSAVDSVKGAGDNREMSLYNWVYSKPWPGQTHYRLRVVSLDGSFYYSPVITVNMKSDSYLLNANPESKSVTRVEYTVAENVTGQLQLIDLSGKIYFNKTVHFIKGMNVQHISTQYLPSGIYMVRVTRKNGIETRKVLISH